LSSKLCKSGGRFGGLAQGGSFLKIDVEGYEEHVLEGARRTIAENGSPPIFTEGVGVRHLLEDYGYAVMPLEPRDFLALAAPPLKRPVAKGGQESV